MYNPKLSFHFIGIGGSGMSGIAEVLLSLGFAVSGSDSKESHVTERLIGLGARVFVGHAAQNIPDGCSSVVYSSAVSSLNPEMVAARERGIPCVRRAEVLAELMRLKFGVAVAGSHGKTTTTSMTAAVLSGLDPTVIVGGQLRTIEGSNAFNKLGEGKKSSESGARVGRGEYLIAESDESDKSFLLLKPTVAVITNIDAEHLGTYGTLSDLKDAFLQFAESVPFYGLCVLCVDDPAVRALASRVTRRLTTYGFSSDADVRGENLIVGPNGSTLDVVVRGEPFGKIRVPMLGRHLALNALAAVAVACEFGIPASTVQETLANFSGVRRRLEYMGCVSGAEIYSDYGHHPTEIQACIKAMRESFTDSLKRLIVVFQPHRYSRTAECFDEFCRSFRDVDELLLTEIYSAGESSIEGISSQRLLEAIRAFSADGSQTLMSGFDDIIAGMYALSLQRGDYILCLGAGSIGAFAETLVAHLEAQNGAKSTVAAG